MPRAYWAKTYIERIMPHNIQRTMPHIERIIPHIERTIPHIEKTIPYIERTIPTLRGSFPHLKRTVRYHSGGNMKLNARILHLAYMVL
jgi:hypothetical protein